MTLTEIALSTAIGILVAFIILGLVEIPYSDIISGPGCRPPRAKK
jgi:hypothetical protein